MADIERITFEGYQIIIWYSFDREDWNIFIKDGSGYYVKYFWRCSKEEAIKEVKLYIQNIDLNPVMEWLKR
jgi:hypothetical protein